MQKILLTAVFFVALPFMGQDNHQLRPDAALLDEINRIQAIDNHSHPPALDNAGQPDDDFDALPCDPLDPTEANTMTRPENPQYLAAWKALWGYSYDDRSDAHVKELVEAKNRMRQEQGDHCNTLVVEDSLVALSPVADVGLGLGEAALYVSETNHR